MTTLAPLDTADALSAVSSKLDNLTAAMLDVAEAVSNLTNVCEQLVTDQAATAATVDALATDARALAESAGTVMAKVQTGGLMGMLMGR